MKLFGTINVAGEDYSEVELVPQTLRRELEFQALLDERPDGMDEDYWAGACVLAVHLHVKGQRPAPEAVLDLNTEDYKALQAAREEAQRKAVRFHRGDSDPVQVDPVPGEGDRLEPGDAGGDAPG